MNLFNQYSVKVKVLPYFSMVGGFDWNMIYKWIQIPDRVKNEMENPAAPIKTATMLGAFFCIRKDYFELLGMYDAEYQVKMISIYHVVRNYLYVYYQLIFVILDLGS